ncbi:MAG TPA: hypothetical protein VJ885_06615 [Thermoanaerobaculia bacterium]|nr:hypothetical protein [Thermoanaerobaculia bacterium]
MLRKLVLAALVVGSSLLGIQPPEASALYPYCSSTYCSPGYPTRRCTCPGTTFSVQCQGWGASCSDLP